MKKSLIAITGVAILFLGAAAAYAEVPSWGNVSADNTGIVLYTAVHAAKGGEMSVAEHALLPGVTYGSDFPGFTSGDNNIGILLAKGAEGAVEGSGAGGMIPGKEEMGTWKSFTKVYPFPVNLARPIIE